MATDIRIPAHKLVRPDKDRFLDEEKPLIRSAISRAVEAVKCAIDNSLISAMNTFNPESSPAEGRDESMSPRRPEARD